MSFAPKGTVDGTLLNFRDELDALGPKRNEAPPRAPVLYMKPASTWSTSGASIALPANVPEVEIGATVAMVRSPPPRWAVTC